MVTAMQWDYRNPSMADRAQYPILNELLKCMYVPKILELNIQQEAPDTTLTEIMVDYTVIFDGTATAKVVYYDSSSAEDGAAGAGIVTIKILSVNEAGSNYQEITDAMAGLTGTATAEKHQRIIAFKGMSAGANGDAEGTITLQDDAGGTNKHATIAAANVSSVSARLYMPDDWAGLMYYLRATLVTASDASALTANDGVMFRPIVHDAVAIAGIDSDEAEVMMVTTESGPREYWNLTPVVPSNGGANYISLGHVTIDTDVNQIASYRIIYIMWGTTNTQRGLPA